LVHLLSLGFSSFLRFDGMAISLSPPYLRFFSFPGSAVLRCPVLAHSPHRRGSGLSFGFPRPLLRPFFVCLPNFTHTVALPPAVIPRATFRFWTLRSALPSGSSKVLPLPPALIFGRRVLFGRNQCGPLLLHFSVFPVPLGAPGLLVVISCTNPGFFSTSNYL